MTGQLAAVAGQVDLERICSAGWADVPAVRARLESAGFGPARWPDLESLVRLDPLDKRDLPALQQATPRLGGLAQPSRQPAACFLSPGGILEPDLPAAEQRLARFMAIAGFAAHDVVLNCFSYHLTPAGLLFHNALRQVGCTVLPGGPQNNDALVELAAKAGATGFVGISSHLKVIAERAEALGMAIGEHIPLRLAMAGAEPYGGAVRAFMWERYGVTCLDFYGSADVGIVAAERPEDRRLILLDGVLAEILDPDSGARRPFGEPGQLVLTVDNPTYPLLRFATGDVTTLHAGHDGEAGWLGPILGRVDSSARVRGLLLHEGQVRQALTAHAAIRGGWVEIRRRGDRDLVAAHLEVAPEALGDAAAAFAERFQSICRLSIDDVAPAEMGATTGSAIRDLRSDEVTAA